MRTGKAVILLISFCMLGLAACGEVVDWEQEAKTTKTKEVKDEVAATISSISVEKDGGISSTIVEDFMESYYDVDGLKSMIESSISEYKAENAAADIKLESCKVKDGVVNVLIEYGDYQTYAGFNNEDFFVGTIKEANFAGYDLNVTLRSSSDNATVSKPELLGMGDNHIVIVGSTQEPDAGQLRVNCYNEILYVGEGVSTVSKKSADISLSDGYKIIVFK